MEIIEKCQKQVLFIVKEIKQIENESNSIVPKKKNSTKKVTTTFYAYQ